MTISPDPSYMRIGNTERSHGTACLRPIKTAGVWTVSSHWSVSRGLPRILFGSVLYSFGPVCWCFQTKSVVSNTAAAQETHATVSGVHTPVPLYVVDEDGCMRPSALRLHAFCWHVCALVQILSDVLTG